MTIFRIAAALLACLICRASDRTAFDLGFERNIGQASPEVTFINHGSNYTVFLAPAGATLRARDSNLKMSLLGANPGSESVSLDPMEARVHYLRGNQEQWHTGALIYGRVEFRNVYPDIDIVYYENHAHLGYTFVLNPGADPAQIRLRFEGSERVRLSEQGEPVLPDSRYEWRHAPPAIHQFSGGTRRNVAGHFRVEGPDEVAFEPADYDRSIPLTIDMTLEYSTYFGGSGQNTATSIVTDLAGNVYVTGWTESLDFPEAAGTRLGAPNDIDVYVAKLNSSGKLVYITYLGGSGDDRSFGIAVDSSGAASVVGWTYSRDFPVVNAAQSRPGGTRDAFVAKLNGAGSALVFSSYLGGSGPDNANGVAVDQQGNIYIAGETASTNFPLFNPFQKLLAGGEDAFISKFSGIGVLLYSTYLGGGADDRATAIAVDASGNVYVTGSTYSSNFPMISACQSTLGGGQDAFVAKIGTTGSSLIYSTYLGGSGGTVGAPEAGNGIAVDLLGFAYVVGTTSSSNFPTSNPIQSFLSGSQDAFVLKLSPSGNSLVYSTYLGGSSIDIGTAITIDGAGRAYVAGYTASTDFPLANAVQSSNAGGYDAFVVSLNSLGSAVEAGTYLGGSGADSAYAIALDSSGAIYVAGQTLSSNFKIVNALQVSEPAPASAFLDKMPGSCLFTLDQDAYAIGTAGGLLAAYLTAPTGCPWTVTNNYPAAVTINSGASGSGSGTIHLTITPNLTANVRTFYLAVGTTQIRIDQPGALQMVALLPCRVMDTRNPNGPLGGPYIAGRVIRTVPLPSSACGVPANAVAYSINITVIPRTAALGYLSVWPTGQPQPVVSTLNSLDGSVLANAAIVPAGSSGAINAFATDDTELIIDINGYFVPPATGTLQFYPLAPCRILDTRNPNGALGGPSLAGGTSRSFPVPSSGCGVPSGASAYSLNVTVVPHGQLGYLTAWPTGYPQPLVSTLDSLDGTVLANAAIVPAGTNGAVSFFAANTTDVIADINGYFAPSGTGGLNFYTVTPCRVVDTRNAAAMLGGPVMSAGTMRTFPLSPGGCGLPPAASAYSLNTTVVPSGFLGYLTVWPSGGSQPLVSTLNAHKGQVVANAALVPAGAGGAVNAYVTNTTHLIIDTNGYFAQ